MPNPNEVAEIQRAREAEFILDHPMVKSALDAIEGYYQKAWLKTKIPDVEEREQAFAMLKCAQAFRALLTEHVTTGKMAALQKDAETASASMSAN